MIDKILEIIQTILFVGIGGIFILMIYMAFQ